MAATLPSEETLMFPQMTHEIAAIHHLMLHASFRVLDYFPYVFVWPFSPNNGSPTLC